MRPLAITVLGLAEACVPQHLDLPPMPTASVMTAAPSIPGEPTADAGAPAIASTSLVDAGPQRLPPREFVEAMRGSERRFRRCYEDGKDKEPPYTGRIVTEIKVEPSGTVSMVEDRGSDTPDSWVAQCVRGVFRNMWFPRADLESHATFPIKFEPAPHADVSADAAAP